MNVKYYLFWQSCPYIKIYNLKTSFFCKSVKFTIHSNNDAQIQLSLHIFNQILIFSVLPTLKHFLSHIMTLYTNSTLRVSLAIQ